MIGALLGLTGKLKTLTDRLTSGRATALDYLDAAVTSRAPSSTALSTAQWTNARAAYLDNLASAIPSSFIQSIQTGYTAAVTSSSTGENRRYVDVTVSAVTVAKSLVLLSDFHTEYTGTKVSVGVTGRLTSTTNLRIASANDTLNPVDFYGRWWVVEFK